MSALRGRDVVQTLAPSLPESPLHVCTGTLIVPVGVCCDLSWLWQMRRQIDLHVGLSGGCFFPGDQSGYAAHAPAKLSLRAKGYFRSSPRFQRTFPVCPRLKWTRCLVTRGFKVKHGGMNMSPSNTLWLTEQRSVGLQLFFCHGDIFL